MSDAPSVTGCRIDGSGTFGSLDGNAQDLQYFYAMQVVNGTTQADVDGGLVNRVEEAVLNDLLPITFPQLCGNTNGGIATAVAVAASVGDQDGSWRQRLRRRLSVRIAPVSEIGKVVPHASSSATTTRRRLEVTGISTIPQDAILPGSE